jgi:hypothetical protein
VSAAAFEWDGVYVDRFEDGVKDRFPRILGGNSAQGQRSGPRAQRGPRQHEPRRGPSCHAASAFPGFCPEMGRAPPNKLLALDVTWKGRVGKTCLIATDFELQDSVSCSAVPVLPSFALGH